MTSKNITRERIEESLNIGTLKTVTIRTSGIGRQPLYGSSNDRQNEHPTRKQLSTLNKHE